MKEYKGFFWTFEPDMCQWKISNDETMMGWVWNFNAEMYSLNDCIECINNDTDYQSYLKHNK